MISKTHHFFLLNLSPWPVVASFSAFNMMFSLLLFFKYSYFHAFSFNLMNIAVCSFLWWIFYGKEFNWMGYNSLMLEKGVKFSMILFISSEVLFFFSFFWSYFHFFLAPTMETGMAWPPLSIETFECLNVPLINTLVLMSSGLTVTLSHFFLNQANKKFFNLFLTLTIFLGSFFTYLQVQEYNSSFFSISDSTFGTSFFVLTGFHGIHVLIGTLFLSVSLLRSINLSVNNKSSINFEMAAWYWHFVDVVWIFLYFLIYYMNN